MQDHELVAMCQQGQMSSFAVLVERYQRMVFGLAWQIMRSREDAEDIAQEAFVRVYQKLRAGEAIDFLPYTKKVATNLALDRLRRRGTVIKYVQNTHVDEVTEHETPESSTMRATEHLMIRDAVAQLPEMYREVVVLHYSAGLSYEEIVDRTQQPMSIVKNRLFRAKKLLKQQLLEVGGGV